MSGALLLVFVMVQQQAPAPAAPATGTAIVRGQITDKETGAAIPRALVTLRQTSTPNTIRQNVADQDGRFQFVNLPDGLYELTATGGEQRATHLRGSFQQNGKRTFLLKNGEVMERANLALLRAFAVSGSVVNESGDPMTGIEVNLLSPAGEMAITARRSDDRGAFRLFGVAPGRYRVCARVQDNWHTQVVAPAVQRIVNTCYPSALTEAESQWVTVTTADVDGIEIRMRQSRTFSLSGAVLDANGAPIDGVHVNLIRYELNSATGSGSVVRSGRFEFAGLTPGEYGVEASIGISRYGDSDGREIQWAHVVVKIDAGDVDDVVVTLKKPASVRGRVVFEDGVPAAQSEQVSIQPRPSDLRRGFSLGNTSSARVGTDQTFTLTGLLGAMDLDVRGLPRGWVVKSIRYNAQDITDAPVEFATDPKQEIEITLTSRVATIVGTVTDDSGNPVPARVYMIPADSRNAAREAVRYRSSSITRGTFTIPGLRAGEYLILAISPDQAQALDRQRATVDAIAKYADRVSLVENDRVTMSLRVVTLPDVR